MSEIKYVDSVALGTFLTEIRKEFKQQIINMVYPVGSIYMSFEAKNPKEIFGGEWEPIQGKFLLSASDSHPVLETGGYEKLQQKHIPYFEGTFGSGNKNNTYGVFRNASGVFSLQNQTQYVYDAADATALTTNPPHRNVKFQIGATEQNQLLSLPPYIAVYMWRRIEDGSDPVETFTLDQSLLDSNDILA